MKKGFFAFTLFILIFVSLCVVGVSFGSEKGSHETSLLDWVWRILNFVILIAVLVWFLKKPMKEYFKNRSALIEKSIKEASEAKAAAEKALKEVEERLSLKDQEVERIIEGSKKAGENERDTLIEDGHRMSEAIKEQAKANIEYELKKAKEQLKAEASMLAIELAEKKIKEKITQEEQLKILEESLKKLEE